MGIRRKIGQIGRLRQAAAEKDRSGLRQPALSRYS
jgi:hypothetical protein